MKSLVSRFLLLFVLACFSLSCARGPQAPKAPVPLKLGYSVSLKSITPANMAAAKAAGVDYVETSLGSFLADDRTFKASEKQIREALRKAKEAADNAGIQIWSIHMPYSQQMDISLLDEQARQEVVAVHKKVLEYCRILQPKVILFHPSYYLGLNEREARKAQMIKSSTELLPAVKSLKATMVIENMLGPKLLADAKRERPLCRTVEETMELLGRLPQEVYAAVDMNHIKNPELLIRALGPRLKSVHVADGTGEKENHWFPCSGKGKNNWVAILAALEEAGYRGPFLYESAHEDIKDLQACYQTLFKAFVASKTQTPQ